MNELENNELIDKLKNNGAHIELIQLMMHGDVYTRGGRLNKSKIRRILGWREQKYKKEIEICQEILSGDLWG